MKIKTTIDVTFARVVDCGGECTEMMYSDALSQSAAAIQSLAGRTSLLGLTIDRTVDNVEVETVHD